MQYNIT